MRNAKLRNQHAVGGWAHMPVEYASYDSLLTGRLKVDPSLPHDSAPSAPRASLKAQPRPQQPQAAPHQLGSQRSLVRSGWKVGSKRGLATFNQQVLLAVAEADAAREALHVHLLVQRGKASL